MAPIDITLSERLGTLHAYWLSKRGAREMPVESDIRLDQIKPLVPYIVVIEEIEGRLRYKLAGEQVSAAYGTELAGRYLDEVLSEARARIASRSYAFAIGAKRPIVSRSNVTAQGGAPLTLTILVLPCAVDGARPPVLLCGFEFDAAAPHASLGPAANVESGDVEFRFL